MGETALRTSKGVPKNAIGDPELIDGNLRFRVSEIYTLADYTNVYPPLISFWSEKITGDASSQHISAASTMRLTVGSNQDDEVIRHTTLYHPYQPGKPMIIMATFNFGAGEEGVVKSIYYGDSGNAIIFRQRDNQLELAIKSNTSGTPVEIVIPQNNWNLDTLDGFGDSGITLDIEKIQFIRFEFVWLGAGSVRFGFEIGNQVVYAHQQDHANLIGKPFMATASLPLGMSIKNTANTTKSNSMEFICASICQEGEPVTTGYLCSVDTFSVTKPVTSSFTPVLGIRLKEVFLGKTNRVAVLPKYLRIESLNNPTLVRVLYNPEITGGTWNDAGTFNPVEYSTDITTFNGGHSMGAFSVPKDGISIVEYAYQKFGSMSFGLDINGENSPIFLITVKSSNQGQSDVRASFEFDAFY